MTTGREMTTEEFREAERQAREYNERVRDICPTCNTSRTRLAEAEDHIRGLVAEMDFYRKLWSQRRELRLAPANSILERARAFLEGSQEVSE